MPNINPVDAANLAQALSGGLGGTALMSDDEKRRQAQLQLQQMQQARLAALQQMSGGPQAQVAPPQKYPF